MMSFENDEIYKKLMTEVLAGYIIVPVIDQSQKGRLIGRRSLARDLYNFLYSENEKLPKQEIIPEINSVKQNKRFGKRGPYKKRRK